MILKTMGETATARENNVWEALGSVITAVRQYPLLHAGNALTRL